MEGILISTRDKNKKEISYTDALLKGLAPDGGLYVPVKYLQISIEELKIIKNMSYPGLAFEIKNKLVGEAIPNDDLKIRLKNAYAEPKFNSQNFNTVPVEEVEKDLFIQNLSLGPTAAFKDMALQELGQEMNYELDRKNEKLIILGATSGDTGSSAEAAVKGLKNITLFMLSPKIGMSTFQKAQMSSLSGGNIFNISVDGRFDDCQDLVKKLKKDPEFSKLGAVNSINWGRISSQVPYFFSGYLQVIKNIGDKVDFVVPTGNFGNVLSGYIAKKMGLPIRKLIIATNENNVLDKLIKTGIYKLTPAQITSSPSMDISKASNYERLLFDMVDRNPETVIEYLKKFEENGKVDLKNFGVDPEIFKQNGFFSDRSTHQERLDTIKRLHNETGKIIDPHSADALTVAKKHKIDDGVPMICMETALPIKFEDTINEALGFIPERKKRFIGIEKNINPNNFYEISNNEDELKDYIRKNI